MLKILHSDIVMAPSDEGKGWGGWLFWKVKAWVLDAVDRWVQKSLESTTDMETLSQVLEKTPWFDTKLVEPIWNLYEELQQNKEIENVGDIATYLVSNKTDDKFQKKYGSLIELAVDETLGSGILGLVLNQIIWFLKS